MPSLKYLQAVPQFTEHFFEFEDEADESIDNGPTGGLTWDIGRVDRGSDQARLPLLSPYEMANPSPDAVVAKVRAAPYAPRDAPGFGADIFAAPAKAFAAILKAFEVFEQDAATFYPYDSKYDAYLAGQATLTVQEARGLAVVRRPRARQLRPLPCQPSRPGRHAAAVHRLWAGRDRGAAQQGDPGQRRSGLPRPGHVRAGPHGPATHPEYCGLF